MNPVAPDLDDRSPWSEYRRLVLGELERINTALERIELELGKVKTEIALLQLKAGAWGAVAGAVVVVGVLLMRYIPGGP